MQNYICLILIRVGAGWIQTPIPQQDPVLSFSYTFLPKSTHVRCWHPKQGWPPKGLVPPVGNSGSTPGWVQLDNQGQIIRGTMFLDDTVPLFM